MSCNVVRHKSRSLKPQEMCRTLPEKSCFSKDCFSPRPEGIYAIAKWKPTFTSTTSSSGQPQNVQNSSQQTPVYSLQSSSGQPQNVQNSSQQTL